VIIDDGDVNRAARVAKLRDARLRCGAVLAYFSNDREVERAEEIQEGEAWWPGPQEEGDESGEVSHEMTIEKHSEGEIILTIRKPDLIGKSMWQFTRGKFPVSARIVDKGWLSRFHDRKVPLLSGDAMRAKVTFFYYFDETGRMIEEKIEITKVLEIIKGPGGEQLSLV
jgi:hypothetical protein